MVTYVGSGKLLEIKQYIKDCEDEYDEWLEDLEEIVYLADFHEKKGHFDQLAELDNRFHTTLYESCDSKMLEHLLKDYHQYVWQIRQKRNRKSENFFFKFFTNK